MGSGARVPENTIIFPGFAKSRRQILVRRPAGPVLQPNLDAKEPLGQSAETSAQLANVTTPKVIESRPGFSKFRIPGVQNRIRAASSQGSVSLHQCPPVIAPTWQKLMFHVEQAPIEQPSAHFGWALNHGPDIGVNCLDRKGAHQVRR